MALTTGNRGHINDVVDIGNRRNSMAKAPVTDTVAAADAASSRPAISPTVALEYARIALSTINGVSCSLARLRDTMREASKDMDESGTVSNWADEIGVAIRVFCLDCENLYQALGEGAVS
jgi:hypothetical protein